MQSLISLRNAFGFKAVNSFNGKSMKEFDAEELYMAPSARPLTYLACPYSHPDRAIRVARYEAANEATALLTLAGHFVFSPISQSHPIAEAHALPTHWEFWAAFDRAFISCCYRIVVLRLDGWDCSTGVTAEIVIAREMGIPIEFMDLERDECSICRRRHGREVQHACE